MREALGDAQRARKSDVFVDTDTGRYIVRTTRGREHIYESNGDVVTTVDNRPNKAHLKRLRAGKIRQITDDEFQEFKKVLQ